MTDQIDLATSVSPDFQALVRLASTRSQSGREEVFRTVSRLLAEDDRLPGERERNLAGDILRHLLGEVELKMRWELALRLAPRADVPEALIADLARDVIEVAEVVLRESPVLSDATLIDIIQERTEAHQLAIAGRRQLSGRVSTALIETDNRRVIVAVIDNDGAELGTDILQQLIEAARADHAYQAALVGRADLPEALARKLYAWVAEPLRRRICARYRIDPAVLEGEIAAAIETSAREGAVEVHRPTRAGLIVETLQAKGSLDFKFLQGALYRGSVDVFVEGLALLSGLDRRLVRRALDDDGPRGLAVACRLAGADTATFVTLYSLSRRRRGHLPRLALDERERLREAFEAMTAEIAREVAAAWSATLPATVDA